jgi:protein-disulfide isomerase
MLLPPRWLFVPFCKSVAVLVLSICVGCSAQSPSSSQQSGKAATAANPQLNSRIENQIRAHFNVPPQVTVTVGAPKPSEIAGYDSVIITMSDGEKTKSYDFLLSKDGTTLARLTKFDISKDPYQEAMSKIDITGRPIRGNKDAPVTIVNYDDFECPFCARMHTAVLDALKKYPDKVRVIYKDYPLSEIHPWADRAANDSDCLAAQNSDAYWDFADYVHANQAAITGKEEHRTEAGMADAVDKVTLDIGRKHNLNDDQLKACVKDQAQKSTVKKSKAEGDSLDVSATPTMFVNGERLEGAVGEDALLGVIRKHLQDQGGGSGPTK